MTAKWQLLFLLIGLALKADQFQNSDKKQLYVLWQGGLNSGGWFCGAADYFGLLGLCRGEWALDGQKQLREEKGVRSVGETERGRGS